MKKEVPKTNGLFNNFPYPMKGKLPIAFLPPSKIKGGGPRVL